MNIFVNQAEYRPRAGWRLGFQFLLFLILGFILFVIKEELVPQDLNIFQSLILTAAAVSSILLSAKFLDRRSFKDYGLALNPTWWYQLLTGLGIGAAAIGFIFLIEWGVGWLTISGFGWERTSSIPYGIWFTSYLFAMILVGFYEELLFRGYQIVNLVDGLQRPNRSPRASAAGALAISSVVFGLLHSGNPGASWISTTSVMLAGVVLALPFLVTGQLALSIGLHISWNFMQGGILGLPVSGKPFRGSLIQIQQTGPAFFTGGSFGPEAGLLGIGGLLFMLGLVYLFIQKSGYSRILHSFFVNPYTNSRKNA